MVVFLRFINPGKMPSSKFSLVSIYNLSSLPFDFVHLGLDNHSPLTGIRASLWLGGLSQQSMVYHPSIWFGFD